MSAKSPASYRRLIQAEFQSRQERNPKYSLRSFSRDIGVSPATVSELMTGRRHLRLKTAALVGKRLGWRSGQIKSMQEEILASRAYNGKPRENGDEKIFFEVENLHALLEWHHMAIAHLAALRNSKATPEWISRKLGISIETAETGLHILIQEGYVAVSNGKLVRGRHPIGPFAVPAPSAKVRQYQKAMIAKSAEAISKLPPGQRLSLIRMIPLDREELGRLERVIWRFYESVRKRAERRPSSDLHCLSVQLFPLTETG